MLQKPKVTVYPPAGGTPEKHTPANARDLVNGAGYSWHPQIKAVPTQSAPFATMTPPTPLEPAQAVLNKAGHNSGREVEKPAPVVENLDIAKGLEADDAIEIEAGVEAADLGVNAEPEPEEDEAVEDTTSEDEAPEEAPAPRRGRGRRAD